MDAQTRRRERRAEKQAQWKAANPLLVGVTAAKNLAEAFEHYNEWHPHSALGYRSPREYLRQQASNGLSDNRCLEI
ncbi:transposase [Escherichia coli]|nr:transposase [Escherichia coli]